MYWNTSGVMTLVTAPAIEPVNIDDVKAHSRISTDADDILIQEKIIGMRMMVEKNNDLALITQTWKLALDRFPYVIQIYKWPVQSITSMKYINAAGTLSTVDSADYLADLRRRPPRIVLAPSASWPTLNDIRPGNVEIEFKAGYGNTPADVPQNVKDYLLFKIADALEMRESYQPGSFAQPDFVENLIASERLHSF